MEIMRSALRLLNDRIFAVLGCNGPRGGDNLENVVKKAVVETECSKLSPEFCGSLADLFANGGVNTVKIDCLFYDDDGMQRLQSVVPLTRIVLDFSKLFNKE